MNDYGTHPIGSRTALSPNLLSSPIFGHSMARVVKILSLSYFLINYNPLNLFELLIKQALASELLFNYWDGLVGRRAAESLSIIERKRGNDVWFTVQSALSAD